jgi:hypothetical protein
MTHCESNKCLGTTGDDGACTCECVTCGNPVKSIQPVRLYGGGFWFVEPNAWTVQRHHGTIFEAQDRKYLEEMRKIYPNAWPIADPPDSGPMHCGHPHLCVGKRVLLEGLNVPSGVDVCSCGCPDCGAIAVRQGIRPREFTLTGRPL